MQGREKKPGKTPKSYANIFKTLESSTTLRALSQGTPRETETHKLGKFHAEKAPDSSLQHIWKKAREVSRPSMRTQKRACPEHSPAAPPPSPPLLGLCGSAESSPFHRERKNSTTHTHTHKPAFSFVEAQAPPLSQHRKRRALCPRRRAVQEGAAGNPHPFVPPRAKNKGFVAKPSQETHLWGNAEGHPRRWSCRGRAARLARPARRDQQQRRQRAAEELPSSGASSQLAKKASPRQSCLTIKGAGPQHS